MSFGDDTMYNAIESISLVPNSGNFEAGTVVEVEQYDPGALAQRSTQSIPEKIDAPTVLDAIEAARVELETWIQYADNAGLSASITRKVVQELTMAELLVKNDPWGIGDLALKHAHTAAL